MQQAFGALAECPHSPRCGSRSRGERSCQGEGSAEVRALRQPPPCASAEPAVGLGPAAQGPGAASGRRPDHMHRGSDEARLEALARGVRGGTSAWMKVFCTE